MSWHFATKQLENNGIREKILLIIKNYTGEIHQYIRINKNKSEREKIILGAPQGTISFQGILLYWIEMTSHAADDCVVFRSAKTRNDTQMNNYIELI